MLINPPKTYPKCPSGKLPYDSVELNVPRGKCPTCGRWFLIVKSDDKFIWLRRHNRDMNTR